MVFGGSEFSEANVTPIEMTAGRIRFLRKRLGLSQEQLGRLLNTHQTLISHWEQGTRHPDEYQVEQLGHLYSCAQRLDEAIHGEFARLLAQRQYAAALALLIMVGAGWEVSGSQAANLSANTRLTVCQPSSPMSLPQSG